MRVVEWPDLEPGELALGGLYFLQGLLAYILVQAHRCRTLEFCDLSLELIPLDPLRERTGEVTTLLRSNLRCRCVGRRRAVPNSEYAAIRPFHFQVV